MKKSSLYALTVLIILFSIAVPPGQSQPVSDTGQTKCYDDTKEIPCPTPGQPFFGQDGNYLINTAYYTKLDAEGNNLPDAATSWHMVRDNLTGLIWEVKTNKDWQQDYNDPHDADNTYTWFNPDSATNGGYSGTPGEGTDTKDFVDSLNNAKFGGFDDWRLPTIRELSSILDLSSYSSSIATTFFPNMDSRYWSATTHAYGPDYACYLSFSDGGDYALKKYQSEGAIAVRGEISNNDFKDNGDGTVTDTSTGLMWEKHFPRDAQWNLVQFNWTDALKHCEDLELDGYDDWRLPTIKELHSIDGYESYGPSKGWPLSNMSGSFFWSATTHISSTDNAWGMIPGYEGYLFLKAYSHFVVCVRGGKASLPGYLSVSIQPEGAKLAGAKWRIAGGPWRDSDFIAGPLLLGSYAIEFSNVDGYLKPDNIDLTPFGAQQTSFTGTYRVQDMIYVNKGDATCGARSPCEASIKAAIELPGDIKLIKIAGDSYGEYLELSSDHVVTLAGGYDESFTSATGTTTVKKVTVDAGTLIVERIAVQESAVAATALEQMVSSANVGSSSSMGSVDGSEGSLLEASKSSVILSSPEQCLLSNLEKFKDSQSVLNTEQTLLVEEFIRNLYQRSLGREPTKEALELGSQYISYLLQELGVNVSQALWDIAADIFSSEEYLAKNKTMDSFLNDAFGCLLWREATAEEKVHLIHDDLTKAEVLYEIISSQEFHEMMVGTFPGLTVKGAGAATAHIYIVLLNRLPDPEELLAQKPCASDHPPYDSACLGLINTLSSSEEFMLLTKTPEQSSRRLEKAGLTLKGEQKWPF